MTGNRSKYDVEAGIDGNLGATLRVAPHENPGGIALVEHTLAPGTLAAPLHRHSHEDELSFILEGEMGIHEGEKDSQKGRDEGDASEEVSVRTVKAGEIAVKQRGIWHTFWNAGTEELRFLEVISPGDFAWYFAEAAEILPEDGLPDEGTRAQLDALHEEYGLEIDPESVPELVERHDIEI